MASRGNRDGPWPTPPAHPIVAGAGADVKSRRGGWVVVSQFSVDNITMYLL